MKNIQTKKNIKSIKHRQSGAALVEWVIVTLPIFALLGLGAYQWLDIYTAKATLNHATMMAARTGSLNQADPDKMKGTLAEYLAPLYSPESGNTADLAKVVTGVANSASVLPESGICPESEHDAKHSCHDVTAHSNLRILNPTLEAFEDFREDVDFDGVAEEIPNVDLKHRSSHIGANSEVNIQDANLLKIEVVYGYRLKVPFAGWVFAEVIQRFTQKNSIEDEMLADQRIPIRASSMIRMQTPAKLNSAIISKDEAEGLADDLLTNSVIRDDLEERPWCSGATGHCNDDSRDVCTGCNCT